MKPRHLIEYALVRSFSFFLKLIGLRCAVVVGENLGALVSLFLPRRRKLILDNLTRAFPTKSSEEKDRIAKTVWRNLGRNAAEFVCLPRITDRNADEFLEWEGVQHVDKAMAEGKGVVLVAAHFANWEVTGWATQYRFGRLLAIARPMRNPLVEKWIQARRTEGGNRIALHRDAVRATLKWLKQKNIVGILADQNLYTGGTFVQFFNRSAATTTLPTLLHVRTGAPVILIYSLRKGSKFVIHYTAPLSLPEGGDTESQLQNGTQIISDEMENLIKKYPENWFWIHNRWKRQP